MLTGTISPALSTTLTKASRSGQPCALEPTDAREILDECKFNVIGQRARSSKTVPELLSVMSGGSWEPDMSEICIALFPDGTMRILNGHNRLQAMSARAVPTQTRVRLIEANDDDDFGLLYSRFDGATTLRSFGLLTRCKGFPLALLPFSGKAPGGGKNPPVVSAAFHLDSRFGEAPRKIGLDGWMKCYPKHFPVFNGMRMLSHRSAYEPGIAGCCGPSTTRYPWLSSLTCGWRMLTCALGSSGAYWVEKGMQRTPFGLGCGSR